MGALCRRVIEIGFKQVFLYETSYQDWFWAWYLVPVAVIIVIIVALWERGKG